MRSYVPNLLSWNAHAAGFFGYVKLPGRRPHSLEHLTLRDGGTVCLSWSSPPVDGAPIVLLLPGINNDASMPYVRNLMQLLEKEGLGHVAALDWRGLGHAGPLTGTTGTPRPKMYFSKRSRHCGRPSTVPSGKSSSGYLTPGSIAALMFWRTTFKLTRYFTVSASSR